MDVLYKFVFLKAWLRWNSLNVIDHTILSAVVSDSMVHRRPGILEDFLKSTVVYVQEHVVFVNKCRCVLRVYLTAVCVIITVTLMMCVNRLQHCYVLS